MDKQQKTGENVENIKFSWVSKLNFMFFVVYPLEGQTCHIQVWGFFTFLAILAYCAECSTYLDINESGNIEENRAEHDRNEVAA